VATRWTRKTSAKKGAHADDGLVSKGGGKPGEEPKRGRGAQISTDGRFPGPIQQPKGNTQVGRTSEREKEKRKKCYRSSADRRGARAKRKKKKKKLKRKATLSREESAKGT